MASIADDLVERWRREAKAFRHRGVNDFAAFLESCAEELEVALLGENDRVLSLSEAAHLSGYSADHLRRMLRAGALPNAGSGGQYGIRRRDLPRKAGHDPDAVPPFTLMGNDG
jgi:hypothetical protein